MRLPFLALAILLVLPSAAPLAGAAHETPYATCQATIGKDIVLVIDRSSSMLDQGKMAAAKSAANALLGTLSPTLDQSAIVSFSTGFELAKGLSFSHAASQTTVNGLVASGATSLGGAVRLARYELDNGLPSPAPGAPYSGNARTGADRIMIVLSDGDQTIHHADPVGEANYAKNARNITVFAIALGTSISPAGLAAMGAMASSPAHFYVSPDPNQLVSIFQQISQKLNDKAAPTVAFTKPVASPTLYSANAAIGASPLAGVSTAVGPFSPVAAASDDCLVDRVEFQLLVGASTIPLGSDHTAPFSASYDCDALPAGRHTIVATAYDWLNKSANATRDLVCVRPHVDAQATSFLTRVTHPDPAVRAEGAFLPTILPGADTHDVVTTAGASPVPHTISALHDEVRGWKPLPNGRHLAADALSRQANASFPSLGLSFSALTSQASVQVDADPSADPLGAGTPFAVRATGSAERVDVESHLIDTTVLEDAEVCTTDLTSQQARVERCGRLVTLTGGVTLHLDERIVVTGPGWIEITVHAVRLLVERPETRAEIVLSRSYAAASWVGTAPLRGPYGALDLDDDAGSGADAPHGPLAANALPLAPGLYGARIANATDVDAYAVAAVPGEKIHATLAASGSTRTHVGSFAPLPAANLGAITSYATSIPGRAPTGATLPSMTIRLLDPAGLIRDTKTILPGAANAVELNVDLPGDWTIVVSAAGVVGEYSLALTRAPAPMTHANDALLGVDAGGSCTTALLVGPGAHVGTLEHGDASDWYRFPLEEGQILALTLRPGDTLEAADMRLRFYAPDCTLLANALAPLAGTVKGSPEIVTFSVPTGAGGLYRAEVGYVNGIGTYELVVATSGVATP